MNVLSVCEATKLALQSKSVASASGWYSDNKALNREGWLTLVARNHILPLITTGRGKAPGKFRISVGWPKGSRGGKGAESIGQCWHPDQSSDKHSEIFISPVLGAFAAVEVLIHELVHASAGVKCKHKGEFKRLAVACGLEGKMTATVAGAELIKTINGWLKELPAFPHGPMTHASRAGKEKKPGSRLIKASCEGCEYTIRLAQKWIEVAPPLCPNPKCEEFQTNMKVEE